MIRTSQLLLLIKNSYAIYWCFAFITRSIYQKYMYKSENIHNSPITRRLQKTRYFMISEYNKFFSCHFKEQKIPLDLKMHLRINAGRIFLYFSGILRTNFCCLTFCLIEPLVGTSDTSRLNGPF